MSAIRHPTNVKRLTLIACILGSFIALLDGTVVNVALPTIERELRGGLAAQQWVTNAYLLTLGSLILIGGSLGDLFGERTIFAVGVAGFGLTSLLCAIAPSIELLIGARALQGVASALLTPSALAVIVATFPDDERGPAIGSWTAWGGIAAVLGPLLGGEILSFASWRWIFVINVPFVAFCLVLIFAVIPKIADEGTRHPIDYLGAVLCALGLGGPVFALIEQPRLGWGSAGVLLPLLAGLGFFALFLLHERRGRTPMLPLALFRRHNFAVGNVETFAMYAGLAVLFFFLVIFLQQVAGYSPLKSGLATLPTTVVMFVLSRRFGALADRYGPRLFMAAGPAVAAGGLLLLLRLGTSVSYLTDLLPALVLFAVGLSMTVAPLTAAVLAGVESNQAGIASGVNNAVARVAGLLGTAALGAIVAAQFTGSLDAKLAGERLDPRGQAAVSAARKLSLGTPDVRGVPTGEARTLTRAAQAASLDAFRLGMGIAAGLLLLGGVMAGIAIENPRRRVTAAYCAGGQLAGASREAGGCDAVPPVPVVNRPAPAGAAR